MERAYWSSQIETFLTADAQSILGALTCGDGFAIESTQRGAWLTEIDILKSTLKAFTGKIYFEYSIPRMGRRADVVLVIGSVIFVLEFKVGEREITSQGIEQVYDYALDIKNFHETSHNCFVAPVLIATEANSIAPVVALGRHGDKTFFPIATNAELLREVIGHVLTLVSTETINIEKWECGRYCPTPTIIEAAAALYNGHSVAEISRSDAGAINLTETSSTIAEVIRSSKQNGRKSICFVTGVPGAGKTLVGLNIANTHLDQKSALYSVFLSGNGPLVRILREALTRDKVARERELGRVARKGTAMSAVKSFIQNVHNFRDECLLNNEEPPVEHVAIFDEAQRAWNLAQTANFMARKKNRPGFSQSEPKFLISCLDRHRDWAVVICLVGGGQEINTGEAGIGEWLDSLEESFPHWDVYVSPQLGDSEYGAQSKVAKLAQTSQVIYKDSLHLSVSMRSFRAEKVSLFVKQVLDNDLSSAHETLKIVTARYPIALTRDVTSAKRWLKDHARGSERYGIVVSSQAVRLKPHAIDVKSPVDPVHWFLEGKDDIRSSFYLEDVCTEFDVQGLELDWTCVTWDADFRHTGQGWEHWSFRNKWTRILQAERKKYLKNAYRVLLTRARQGMVIVVPEGERDDLTRDPAFYDSTFEYLRSIGIPVL